MVAVDLGQILECFFVSSNTVKIIRKMKDIFHISIIRFFEKEFPYGYIVQMQP